MLSLLAMEIDRDDVATIKIGRRLNTNQYDNDNSVKCQYSLENLRKNKIPNQFLLFIN